MPALLLGQLGGPTDSAFRCCLFTADNNMIMMVGGRERSDSWLGSVSGDSVTVVWKWKSDHSRRESGFGKWNMQSIYKRSMHATYVDCNDYLC